MIKRIYLVFRREGFFNFLKIITARVVSSVIGLPIALGMFAISPWIKIRLIRLFSYRIGHYAHNTEFLLCALEMNVFNDSKNTKTFFYTVPHQPLCNTQLHKMWKRKLWILPFAPLWSQVDRYLLFLRGESYRNDQLKKIFETAEGGHDKWQFLEKTNKCHISFSPREESKAKKILQQLGIPPGKRFICLLVRDPKYLQVHMPNENWSYHDYRNVNIQNYEKAAEYLASKGYYVVRMGKFVSEKFDLNNPQIIDYANSPLRSDFMDIYLSANCYFIITTCTGLDSVTQIFRRPYLATNVPLFDLQSYYYWTMFIPSKIKDLKENELLKIKDVFQARALLKDKRLLTQTMQEKNWGLVENSPDEIVEAVDDMLKILEKNQNEASESKLLQKRFWSSFPIELPLGLSSYENLKMQIGESFLRKNELMLD